MSQIADRQGQSALTESQQLIYEAYLNHSGRAFADRWAKRQLAVTTSPREEAADKLEAEAKRLSKRLLLASDFYERPFYRSKQARLEGLHAYLMSFVLTCCQLDAGGAVQKRTTTGSLTLFVGMDLVKLGACAELGVSHSTFWAYLNVLKGCGLLDYRGHVAATEHGPRRDGTLLKLKLSPQAESRLDRFDFADETYRDLDDDVAKGHTFFKAVRKLKQSLERLKAKSQLTSVIAMSVLNPAASLHEKLEEFLLSDCTDFVSLFVPAHAVDLAKLAEVKRDERNEVVDRQAHLMMTALEDWRSLDYYRKLCWQLLRAYDRGWDHLAEVQRELAAVVSQDYKRVRQRPGFVFHRRVSRAGYFEEVWRDPGQWVSTVPPTVEA